MAIKVTGSTVIDDNKIFLPTNSSAVSASPTISSSVLTLDLNTAAVFTVTLNANITTLTVTNVQTSGRSSSFVLVFICDGSQRSVVWPASFKWPNGIAPTLSYANNQRDVFTFFTVDNGTTWQAFISGQSL